MSFRDVTQMSKISQKGISHGAAAADFDGDGWVDVLTNNHYAGPPGLWRNRGDGTFENVVKTVMDPVPPHPHGCQWADVNNDGAPDLLILRGGGRGEGERPNSLHLNQNGRLVETKVGLDYELSRGRTPLALDVDQDGKLDFVLAAQERPDGVAPTGYFHQDDSGQFEDQTEAVGLTVGTCQLGALADLDDDGRLDVLFNTTPPTALSVRPTLMVDLSDDLGLPRAKAPTIRDLVVGDFTNDGRNEIYLAKQTQLNRVQLVSPNMIEASINTNGNRLGFTFRQEGSDSIEIIAGPLINIGLDEIFLGAEGDHPKRRRLFLSPEQPRNHGLFSGASEEEAGIFVGFDPSTRLWEVQFASQGRRSYLFVVLSRDPLGEVTCVGFDANEARGVPDAFLVKQEGRYADVAVASGLGIVTESESVVAADFDNDMDLDLYVVTTTPTENTPNILYSNQGDGSFQRVPEAGGAEGSRRGRGEAVITLDYNRDGKIDLLVMNGEGPKVIRFETEHFSDDGPVQLLENTTDNNNHWLSIQLVGTQSNRDGIGAVVTVTAGGVTQRRDHGGGMHRHSQNHGIHFGLGKHERADKVEVRWPSGVLQVLTDVPADTRLVVTEEAPGDEIAPEPSAKVPDGSISFREVTQQAGIIKRGITHGVTAGDFDRDGFVDIFTDNHYDGPPQLWHNGGDGTFKNVIQERMEPVPPHPHGAQWADVNNDGFPELLILRGGGRGEGENPNSIYLNTGDRLVETELGLEYPHSRGRTPLALDYDKDGRLDFLLTAQSRPDGVAPSAYFQQEDSGQFVDLTESLGVPTGTARFGMLADLTGDGRLDLFMDTGPLTAFAIESIPMMDISNEINLPKARIHGVKDAVIADFNGDGVNEIFLARSFNRSDVHFLTPTSIEGSFFTNRGYGGFTFRQQGTKRIKFVVGSHLNVNVEDIYVGASGNHPKSKRCYLSSRDQENWGMFPSEPGEQNGVFIGFDDSTGLWKVLCNSISYKKFLIVVESPDLLSELTPIGGEPPMSGGFDDWMLTLKNGRYKNTSAMAGLQGLGTESQSVVAADFDNDMDLDLYVVTTTPTVNSPNVLLSNQGDGTFEVVLDAAGAAGSTLGRGESVIRLDYNRDGKVDLFVTNGEGPRLIRSENRYFSDDGPFQLFENTTQNENHWLAVELVGTRSNRDGIGAVITVTTGGRTQRWECTGGMHRYSQNHGIHFGLGANSKADRVEVRWPSGQQQTLTAVPADQFLEIVEP